MISLHKVCFSYANAREGDCVKDMTLRVQKGEFVVLTGASGSGKTTVTRIINGLAPAFYEGTLTGEVHLNGKNASGLPMWERGQIVGSVFQDPRSQFFSPQVEGEIAFGCENLGVGHDEIHRRVEESIADLGIEELRGRSLHQLSNGEKQKIAIASIRAMGPLVYVFDEPSSNLDTEATIQLGLLMKKLKEQGCTIVVAEHRLYYLMDLADRFLYLRDGQIEREFASREMREMSSDTLAAFGLRSTTLVPVEKKRYSKTCRGCLCIEGLCFSYGKQNVFENACLHVDAGEIVGITGANGIGKTTLAKVLCGLYGETGGQVLLSGKRLPRRKRLQQIRFVMHDTASQLFGESLLDELLLMTKKRPEDIERARALLMEFGLYEYRGRHPITLSGGQKQRLVLAAALMQDAKVLILDEPTSGLDAINMRLAAMSLKRAAAGGRIVLVITHDNEFIRESCTRVLDLRTLCQIEREGFG